jgi:hypothetical protein
MASRAFCTLFDKYYLFQGVALHRSLVRHAGDFKLYALCMDGPTYELLAKMRSKTLIPISVDELMTPEISEVRERTTHGQFCWVCQPLICHFILDRFEPDMVTYLESDSMFFSDPAALFDELGMKSVSVVPHNYSAEFDNSADAGQFCVQFNAFRNEAAARRVLSHWKECCFKYDKAAPHKYPGQTCLDDWPARFDCVAVIKHRGAGVAPWNVRGYDLCCDHPVPRVDGAPVVFYHYHQYGRLKSGGYELGGYPMTTSVVDCFYRPYIAELDRTECVVRAIDPKFSYRREYPDHCTFRDVLRSFSRDRIIEYFGVAKRKLRGRYNVYPDGYFSDEPRGSSG